MEIEIEEDYSSLVYQSILHSSDRSDHRDSSHQVHTGIIESGFRVPNYHSLW